MPIDPFDVVRPRKPSFSRLIMMDTVQGVQRVRIWPKKRGKGKTPGERERAEKFRKANAISKYFPAIIQTQVREAVKGTPLMPRDLLIQMLYGRFSAIGMADGRKLFPLVARRDISDSLDVLGQVPGDVLFRGPELWQRLPIGEPGQILVVSEEGLPEWVTVEGGSGTQGSNINTIEGTSSGAYGDLATVGPQVSLVTGESALIMMSAIVVKTTGSSGNTAFMAVAISGATTIAPTDAFSTQDSSEFAGFAASISRSYVVTGLTPGLNTFTVKYRVDGENWVFLNRSLVVTAL